MELIGLAGVQEEEEFEFEVALPEDARLKRRESYYSTVDFSFELCNDYLPQAREATKYVLFPSYCISSLLYFFVLCNSHPKQAYSCACTAHDGTLDMCLTNCLFKTIVFSGIYEI